MVKACATEFFLSKEIKLPCDLESALHFHANTHIPNHYTVLGPASRHVGIISRAAAQTQDEWGALIPPEISYAAKGIRTAPIATLLEAHGIGGGKWHCQFACGFPIGGPPSSKGVFPISEKE